MGNVEVKQEPAPAPVQEPEKKTRNPFKKHHKDKKGKKHDADSKSDVASEATSSVSDGGAQGPAPFHSGEPTDKYYKIGDILGE